MREFEAGHAIILALLYLHGQIRLQVYASDDFAEGALSPEF